MKGGSTGNQGNVPHNLGKAARAASTWLVPDTTCFAAKPQKFEVGRHTESTATKKKGVRRGEELAWDEELQIDLDNSADAELHVRPWNAQVPLGPLTISLLLRICCLCAICRAVTRDRSQAATTLSELLAVQHQRARS